VARAREVELDCEAPFAVAAAKVVRVRTKEVLAHADGVLDIGEPERVHDMRVATRRLRAALEIFEPCFPPKRWRKALKRVKVLADALGERRDLDVEIELVEGLAAELDSDGRAGLDRLLDRMREERRAANEGLAPHVAARRLKKLRRRLRKLARSARG